MREGIFILPGFLRNQFYLIRVWVIIFEMFSHQLMPISSLLSHAAWCHFYHVFTFVISFSFLYLHIWWMHSKQKIIMIRWYWKMARLFAAFNYRSVALLFNYTSVFLSCKVLFATSSCERKNCKWNENELPSNRLVEM